MNASAGSPERPVVVHVDEEAVGAGPVRVGVAHVRARRGVTTTSFVYDDAYQRLAVPGQRAVVEVSPDLPVANARGHTNGLPGALADCAPDRWGRNLVARRLRAAAVAEGRTPPEVTEADYLLGVSDLSRQGSLRLGVPGAPGFLGADVDVPRLVDLPRLLHAADSVAREAPDETVVEALKTLLDAGSASLGGARPKASVQDEGTLLIAKFPHPGDDRDVMAWEKTALDLAAAAGVEVPARRLARVGGRHVLLVRRFDRASSGRRIGYVSAMTLLGSADGEPQDYLELAEAIADHGTRVAHDLGALWRRVAVSLALNNVDDHPRNHGFLRDGAGWRLSPAFDVNPEPGPAHVRAMTIGWETRREKCVRALLGSVSAFGLSEARARAVLDEVVAAVRRWRQVAAANGVSESEARRFAATFERGCELLSG